MRLDADAVRAATPWPELIAAIAGALTEDAVTAPERHVHPVGLPGGGTGAVPVDARLGGHGDDRRQGRHLLPSNAGTDVPTVNAAYLAFDGGTGQVLAVLDGDELTARRTAAISALAADRLARPDAQHLLVVGTGALAPNMARAHASVRPLARIEVWGRRPEAAASVAETLRAEGLPAEASDNLDASVGRADIVSCVTGATQPLVRGGLLSGGAHLDLVGSFQPDMRESDNEAASRATIFVDTAAGALLSGDLAQPLADGVITEASITADLRALVAGEHPGRTDPEEITLFKSAGFAAADLAAARLALR